MPEGPDGKTIIIVKKVSGHGGHHGGAWKVAYADFVTAMMALFLVLWLVNSASVQTKEAIASYFRRPGVFERGSGTPLEIGGAGILPDTFAPPADSIAQIMQHKRIYDSESLGERGKEGIGGTSGEEPAQDAGKEQREQELLDFEEIASEIEQVLNEKKKELEGMLGDVDIQVDQRGLVIEIMDTPKASMFQSGRANVLPDAEKALSNISQILSKLPNPVDIEGHTDAIPFRSTGLDAYDNWDLSTDRANAARRVLERSGIKQWQIARVVGYSDQRLKIPTDPKAASNRRISISMRFTEQAAKELRGTNTKETSSTPLKMRNSGQKTVIKQTKPKPPRKRILEQLDPNAADAKTSVMVQPFVASNEMETDGADDLQEFNSQLERSRVIEEINNNFDAGELQVEVREQAPEGTPIPSTDADLEPSRPLHIEKDKIFDSGNGFFD